MATHTLDIPAFRALFPAYVNVLAYPDVRLLLLWTQATVFMGDEDGPLLDGAQMQLCLNLLTAHLVATGDALATGQTQVAVVTQSQIDKVVVSLAKPPTRNGWEFWLAASAYGSQLLALLTALGAGGFYIGGSPERAAFRRAGGWP